MYEPGLIGLSYTVEAIFVYEPGLIGLSYTVEAIFVYESMFFGLSYTKKAIFVHGDREVPPLNSQKGAHPVTDWSVQPSQRAQTWDLLPPASPKSYKYF